MSFQLFRSVLTLLPTITPDDSDTGGERESYLVEVEIGEYINGADDGVLTSFSRQEGLGHFWNTGGYTGHCLLRGVRLEGRSKPKSPGSPHILT